MFAILKCSNSCFCPFVSFPFLQEFENKIKQWCQEAGEDVSYEFIQVWLRDNGTELFMSVLNSLHRNAQLCLSKY